MDNLIGKTLGRYQIIELAGKGGMATVYKAHQPSLNRYVALKVLPDYLAQDEQFVARFRQEALAAAALRHPNIMVVYDVGQDGDTHYIAAEFLEGQTLSQVLIDQRGPLPLPRIVNIINQLASALDFAHQRGLVHRDIKPSNVFIGPDDHVTLMDFGIVKALSGSGGMTRTGMMIGTPEYMSPEQAEGKAIDQRSDIYSLGAVIYQLITGRVPFEAETPTAVLLAHITQPPRLPSQINPQVPRQVETVVMRALAKKPIERFGSAGELARALTQAAGQPALSVGAQAPAHVAPTVAAPPVAQTPPPGYAPPPPPPPARKTNWLLWIGVGVGALVLVCIVSFVGCGALGALVGNGTPTPTRALVQAAPGVTPQPTPRPAATSLSKPSPAATPSVLFTDDFKSQKDSEDKGWSFKSGDNVDYTWSAGKLAITVRKANWLGLKWPDGEYSDFAAELEAQAASNAYAEYGLVFRVTGESDTRSYYIFGITTNGKYYLQKKLNGEWVDTDPVSTTASQYIKQGQTKNILRVLARGGKISLFANGFLLTSVEDSDIESGSVGVFAGTGDNDTTSAAFTRLTLFDAQEAAAGWGVK